MNLLPRAALDWDGASPRDRRSGDIYFNPDQARGEIGHVFLRGIGAPACWEKSKRFVIGETGFGTGMNFLCAWDLWRRTRAGRLHFVSVEGFPMTPDDISRAAAPFADLAPLANALADQWPPAEPGVHRRLFDDGRVALTLLFGSAANVLADYDMTADAWFLDGFAPAKNPHMWSQELLGQVTRLSKPGAVSASFTVAGPVRQALSSLGWRVEKIPGFGRKRECLRAVLATPRPFGYQGKPWFAPQAPRTGQVAVIGSGLAADAVRRSLRDEQADVIHIADASAPAASDVPAAITAPRLALGEGAAARFDARIFLHHQARRDPNDGDLISLVDDPQRLEALSARFDWGNRHLTAMSSDQISACLGTRSLSPGFRIYKAGAWQRGPTKLPQIDAKLLKLIPVSNGWRILWQGGALEVENLVVAAGAGTPETLPDAGLGLRISLGRIFRYPQPLAMALSYGGYAVPDGGGLWLGSSFEIPDSPDDNPEPAVRGKLSAHLPDLADALPATSDHWCGLRVTTADHLPVAGPVARLSQLRQDYAALSRDRLTPGLPALAALPGLYMVSGLGARGGQSSDLLGQLIASQITGAPPPLERSLIEAVHPARAAIRALVRREDALN